jgi:hypothetical protein
MGVDDDGRLRPPLSPYSILQLLYPTRPNSITPVRLPHRDGVAAHRAHENSLYMSARIKNLAATPEYGIHMSKSRRSAERIDGATPCPWVNVNRYGTVKGPTNRGYETRSEQNPLRSPEPPP